jgi:hypothetical protein
MRWCRSLQDRWSCLTPIASWGSVAAAEMTRNPRSHCSWSDHSASYSRRCFVRDPSVHSQYRFYWSLTSRSLTTRMSLRPIKAILRVYTWVTNKTPTAITSRMIWPTTVTSRISSHLSSSYRTSRSNRGQTTPTILKRSTSPHTESSLLRKTNRLRIS